MSTVPKCQALHIVRFAVLLVGTNFYARPEYLTIAINDLKFTFPPLIITADLLNFQ